MAVLSRSSGRRLTRPMVTSERSGLVGKLAVDVLLTGGAIRGLWLMENLMALMTFGVAKGMRVMSGRDGRDVV